MLESNRPASAVARVLILVSFLTVPMARGAAQADSTPEPSSIPKSATFMPDEVLVHFSTRSFDLDELTRAHRAGEPAKVTEKIIAGYRAQTAVDRRGFDAAIQRLGGRVVENFWLIDVAWISISDNRLDDIARLPGVARVEHNRILRFAMKDATNRKNHDSDAANKLTVGDVRITGAGVGIAMLDSGVDRTMGNSGRPHATYYPGGNPLNKTGKGIQGSRLRAAVGVFSANDIEDTNGHGTKTSSCAAGAGWTNAATVDDGCAPGADIVGLKVSPGSVPGTTVAVMTRAWQTAVTLRSRYDIRVANASIGGSPSMTGADQQALDAAAVTGDMLITAAAGNSSTNLSSTANAYNGLSVGSVFKDLHNLSSFSGRGSIRSGTGLRLIPDCVGIGSNVIAPDRDSEAAPTRFVRGTSFSAPFVAGIAALVRQTNPKLTALETKAILLNTTLGAMTSMGAGFVKAPAAVTAVMRGETRMAKLTSRTQSSAFPFAATANRQRSVTITWNRTKYTTIRLDNLDLLVQDPRGTVVGQSTKDSNNSWEKVTFTPRTTGRYTAVVRGKLISPSVEFAITGAHDKTAPKLTAISTATMQAYTTSATVTLTGTDLQYVTTVHVGKTSVSPTSVSATRCTFDAPRPTALGKVRITVTSAGGTSNALGLSYIATAPPRFVGDLNLDSTRTHTDHIWGCANCVSFGYVSLSSTPSVIPGIVNLGLGSNFTQLFLFGRLQTDGVGHATFKFSPPASGKGFQFHMQHVVLEPVGQGFPFPTTNVLKRSVNR